MDKGLNAVVILSYNSRKWHELFLPLIVEEGKQQYDVYVVDHASPDDTADYIIQHFPTVKLIRLTENHGFAWGYAQALKQIQAKYYVLLSADFEVTPNWFRPLWNSMEQHPEWAACQPKIRYYKDRPYFEYAGAAGGFIDKWGYLFCRGRLFDTLEKDEGQYDDDCEIFWASGGCFMVRAEAYHRVGGLDPDLESHMEEVDLCWRLGNAGYRIGYVGGSTVFHVGGSVISYGSPQKAFFNFRNSLILLLKNAPLSRSAWLIPWRLGLDFFAALLFLFKGEFKQIGAIAKAHWSFLGHLAFWNKKRKALPEPTPQGLTNKAGRYKGSIVWAYYAQGKKKFSQLPAHRFEK